MNIPRTVMGAILGFLFFLGLGQSALLYGINPQLMALYLLNCITLGVVLAK